MNTLTINNIDNAAYVWDRLAWDSSIRIELVRELSTNEIDEVNGGIQWAGVGASLVAIGGGIGGIGIGLTFLPGGQVPGAVLLIIGGGIGGIGGIGGSIWLTAALIHSD